MIRKIIKFFFLKTFIWEFLTKFKNKFLLKFGKSFSADQIDIKLRRYLDYKDGFFIELGANDGVRQSNTLHFEKFLNWSGILIEPSIRFKDLVKNRSKKNYFYNIACCSFDDKNLYKKLLYMDLYTKSEKLIRNQDKYKFAIKNEHSVKVEEFLISQRSLNEILLESNAPKNIDFLSLDVEGTELEVLQGIDFNTFSIKYILVEGRLEDKMTLKIRSLLENNNYKVLEVFKSDILYCLK